MRNLHDDGTEVQAISPERRKALLSGDRRTYTSHMMDNDPEYRDAIIAQKKEQYTRQARELEQFNKKYSTITQLVKDNVVIE